MEKALTRVENLRKLAEIHRHFVETGEFLEPIDPVIAASWQECRALGVDVNGGMARRASKEVFSSILAENSELLELSTPIIQNLVSTMDDAHCVIVLTDPVGYILSIVGNQQYIRDAEDTALFSPGCIWSNQDVGTNAISLALQYDRLMETAYAEHYCRPQHSGYCCAMPIHNEAGEIVGCLDISAELPDGWEDGNITLNPLMNAVIISAVQGIEAQFLVRAQNQNLQTMMDATSDCLLLMDEHNTLIWCNNAAKRQLGLPVQLNVQDFDTWFPDINWTEIKSSENGILHRLIDSTLQNKLLHNTSRASVLITPIKIHGNQKSYYIMLNQQERVLQTVNKLSGNRAIYHFDDILFQDDSMRRITATAKKFAQYDGTILIEGESGTGKELFAQAIHNASSRASGPFVAINCASIPLELAESELFGYEKGAFTGASKDGKPGKFELANNGTLFLDEIGEMSLELQAKLLRVLETNRITRIGGTKVCELNIRVIAATNRTLNTEVKNHKFRQDLYYRLNVLSLRIPPLRERKPDIATLVRYFIDELNEKYPSERREFQPEFLEVLQGYSWPGNVRELQNAIARAFYISDGNTFTKEDALYITNQLHVTAERTDRGNIFASVSADPESRYISEEERKIIHALTECSYDVLQAAAMLGMSRATLYRYLKKYDISLKHLKLSAYHPVYDN